MVVSLPGVDVVETVVGALVGGAVGVPVGGTAVGRVVGGVVGDRGVDVLVLPLSTGVTPEKVAGRGAGRTHR